MNAEAPTKVLVVDDHPVVRQGLLLSLQREPGILISGDVGGIREALAAIVADKPDLVLTDLDLEDGSGLDLIKKIKDSHPDVNALVLSMHDEKLYAERALRAGARGYVMKQEPLSRLTEAIQTVMQGKIALSEAMSAKALENYAGKKKGDSFASPLDVLTDRELQVFQLVGQAAGTRWISDKLSVSVKTVEAHIAHIKQKLGLSSGTELQHRAFLWAENQKAGKLPI